MPNVSEEFVAHAERLAQGTKQQLEKDAAAKQTLQKTAEMTADTLVNTGIVPESQKAAAVQALLDHEQALQALNKTAQTLTARRPGEVPAPQMGQAMAQEKQASAQQPQTRESDRVLLSGLGFSV